MSTENGGDGGVRERFVEHLPFALDGFQVEALDALDAGASVVVAAPTGSGKTVVAEYAIARALSIGKRVFYTAPIKALSNQKYHDLVAWLGADKVGLLTGDNVVNDSAPVIVMTTEVLRNMIYARPAALDGLRYAVLDEVHYLQDPYRGQVWEEIIINAPLDIDLVCLSATVSNAEELAAWVTSVRGTTAAVLHAERPIELRHLYLVGHPGGDVEMVPTFVSGRTNPRGSRFDATGDGGRWASSRSDVATPRRTEVIEALHEADMLPAITFIFSRAACDDAVRACLAKDLKLTTPRERRLIADIADEHARVLTERERMVLGFDTFVTALQAGYAAHHAGMVPAFKEAVEACFVRGLVKAVFATETLALGVNMPARTVVIEKLSKFSGERHAFLTPAELTQMAGRAGRRGLDPVGFAATLWSPFVPFEDVAALASLRTYELRSSFRPTNNMAVNLIRHHTREQTHHLLGLSFAQHQINRELLKLAKRADDLRAELGVALEDATCERGSVEEHVRVTERRTRRPAGDDASIAAALAALRPGDVLAPVGADGSVVEVARGARPGDGWLVVVGIAERRGRGPTLRAIGPNAKLVSLTRPDFRSTPVVHAQIRLPQPFNPNSRSFVGAAAGALQKVMQRAGVSRSGLRTGGAERDGHTPPPDGVAACPDLRRHLEALRKAERLEPEIDRIDRVVRTRKGSVTSQFEHVATLLERRGYVAGWEVTEAGDLLAGIFHESDLLIAEVLRAGILDGLTPVQLAGLASVFVFEDRGPGAAQRREDLRARARTRERRPADTRHAHGDLPPGFPKNLAPRWFSIERLTLALNAEESELALPLTRATDPGFVGPALRWASGTQLDVVLADAAEGGSVLAGGDFVRTVKTLVDLLRQIATVAPNEATRTAARQAAESLGRGVVTASSFTTPGQAVLPR